MRRIANIVLLTLLVCIVALVLSKVASDAYSRSEYTAATGRIADLEIKMQELKNTVISKSHPRWQIRTGWFSISTTDRPAGTNWHDFRLVYGTNSPQVFKDGVWKESGRIMTVWVSEWTPRSEMAKFEQFSVSASNDHGGFQVLAKARPGESIAMDFIMTFIVEH